jgi:hypothetical protein
MPPLRLARSSASKRRPVIDQNLRALLDTSKRQTRLLGDVQRYLLQPGANDGWRNDALHPSEISHNDWCPRASYYRLAGVQPLKEAPATHWQMRMIFDEGTEIHRKWQHRIWDIGRLGGTFYCQSCHFAWGAVAPSVCANCGATREFLLYHEVPLLDHKLGLVGHADGLDGEDVIEIKSIGLNSLRFEAPDLIKNHTHKFNINGKSRTFLDYDGIWDSIRIPFATHIRQGDFYCYMGGYKTVIFIYECKWNQRVKELVVKHRVERIESRLEQCRQIRWALDGRRIPDCPFDGCTDCQRYEEPDAQPTARRLVLRSPHTTEATPGPARNGSQATGRRLLRPGAQGAGGAGLRATPA